MDVGPVLTRLADGTVKQVNPFTGTQVWTVPGRAHRPLASALPPPRPIPAEQEGSHCAFCPGRYRETPPEIERVVRADGEWRRLLDLPPEQLDATVAEFRLVPNLFEIISYDYWVANHGFAPGEAACRRHAAYLASGAGRAHLGALLRNRRAAAGGDPAEVEALSADQLEEETHRFFSGGHHLVIARRHYVDGAETDDQLASAGTLTPDEHEQYVALTIRAMADLYDVNPGIVLVAAFQNWLRPAGASFDHLHKQLVGVDEYGTDLQAQLARLETEPNLYERWGPRHAEEHGLVIARNGHAVAIAGIGHRYPAVEVWSSVPGRPWELSAQVVRDFSDLLHAVHAATGSAVPSNEEWHHQPPGVVLDSPMRVVVKWRTATLAGFEGGTRIYLNTLDPWAVRERVLAGIQPLLEAGRLGDLTPAEA